VRPRLDQLRDAPLTYADVGATARGDSLPHGYHHLHRSQLVGKGPDCFAAAAASLMAWRVHERAGLAVVASTAVVRTAAIVVLTLAVGPLRIAAPCLLVYVVDEERTKGFGYGTLAGHPESGEEAFVVRRHDDDTVTFTVTAFSRPARWYARLGAPLTRRFQCRIVDRYLHALAGS
jgi:uncharacterized protein (UPF0548 family)